jgi:hypothetical protein
MAKQKKEEPKNEGKTPYRFPAMYPTVPVEEFRSKTDPLGSYTGNEMNGETPVQDADDL